MLFLCWLPSVLFVLVFHPCLCSSLPRLTFSYSSWLLCFWTICPHFLATYSFCSRFLAISLPDNKLFPLPLFMFPSFAHVSIPICPGTPKPPPVTQDHWFSNQILVLLVFLKLFMPHSAFFCCFMGFVILIHVFWWR